VEPKTAEQFLTRAKRRLGTGCLDAAAAAAAAVLEINSRLAEAMVIRGRLFLAKNDPQTAIEDLDDAVKLTSGSYDLRVTRGRANRATGKNADAIADFSAAIRINFATGSLTTSAG
jgi:tetratricopeptide (TPR) repeat protein